MNRPASRDDRLWHAVTAALTALVTGFAFIPALGAIIHRIVS